jgi:hypothetical protein
MKNEQEKKLPKTATIKSFFPSVKKSVEQDNNEIKKSQKNQNTEIIELQSPNAILKEKPAEVILIVAPHENLKKDLTPVAIRSIKSNKKQKLKNKNSLSDTTGTVKNILTTETKKPEKKIMFANIANFFAPNKAAKKAIDINTFENKNEKFTYLCNDNENNNINSKAVLIDIVSLLSPIPTRVSADAEVIEIDNEKNESKTKNNVVYIESTQNSIIGDEGINDDKDPNFLSTLQVEEQPTTTTAITIETKNNADIEDDAASICCIQNNSNNNNDNSNENNDNNNDGRRMSKRIRAQREFYAPEPPEPMQTRSKNKSGNDELKEFLSDDDDSVMDKKKNNGRKKLKKNSAAATSFFLNKVLIIFFFFFFFFEYKI